MKNFVIFISMIALLTSCSKERVCPICGETDSRVEFEVIENHDIATPYRLDKGLKCKTEKEEVVIISENLILRATQRMERECEVCSSCGYIHSKVYHNKFDEFEYFDVSYVHYFIEEIGTGKVVFDFGYRTGGVILK